MSDKLVTARIPKEIADSLAYYVPAEFGGDTSISARVRYGLLAWLHERGSCLHLPRVASSTHRRSTGQARRRRRRK